MDPAMLENDGSDHSVVSQHFLVGVVLGPVSILVVDLVSSESDGEVVSGSEPSINEVDAEAAEQPLAPFSQSRSTSKSSKGQRSPR